MTAHYYCLLAGKLFDSDARVLLTNKAITIERHRGIILDIRSINDPPFSPNSNETEMIDLRHLVVIPGFVDVHVHMFLHPYSEVSWNDQLTKESLAERTLRASVHARRTLLAGFTTVRDLGTEGAFDADIALRKCLAGRDPIVVGPRYYCANRAIVTTGSYGPKSGIHFSTEGVEGITGAEAADGKDECVKAVRRQIGAGADWVKIYADYRVRSRVVDVSPNVSAQSIKMFSDDELKAMIDTAHGLGVKVAAHANTPQAIRSLLRLGIDTVEHGAEMVKEGDDTLVREFAAKESVTWVPTLGAYYTSGGESSKGWRQCVKTFTRAVVEQNGAKMDNIACGGDTGVFAHGQNALELVLMRQIGAGWEKVLSWATLGGWRCWAADIIALEGSIDGDFGEFKKAVESVSFVMKGGRVYKRDGQAILPL
ncbi:hypothetical protein AMATHDRAFT_148574 [Amanita thiersii Skay4041]|uniref:Amidohydrolase-related domain-containing protein n=1 Tax=Amanita thiersii Skay4041 TaxID=703135 RepID=A0A2A9NL40_9AGAR|nr:hypothetical protein AMATHDRAFT_148574 [Amanita thiersii Skay4041]